MNNFELWWRSLRFSMNHFFRQKFIDKIFLNLLQDIFIHQKMFKGFLDLQYPFLLIINCLHGRNIKYILKNIERWTLFFLKYFIGFIVFFYFLLLLDIPIWKNPVFHIFINHTISIVVFKAFRNLIFFRDAPNQEFFYKSIKIRNQVV